MTELESVPCDLCGARDPVPVYRMPDQFFHPDEWFTIVACRSCGLGWVDPRPTPAAMGRYYPSAFFDPFRTDRAGNARRYAREAAIVEGAVPARGRLLDVGCADGDFPRLMQGRGWDVEGVEVSATAAPVTDFPVHRSPLPELDLPPASFDAVTAWAVLEHTHAPGAYIQAAARLLRPGGAFVFLVTNFESLSSWALFREDPPRHTYYFTRATVGRYLERAGLTLERWTTDDRIYEMVPLGWLHHWLRRLTGRPALTWETLPAWRHQWFTQTGVRPGALGTLRFAMARPVSALDQGLARLYGRAQALVGRYGIAICIARKPPTGDRAPPR